MTNPVSIAAELERLLSILSAQGGAHLEEVETDLSQTGELLTEAIEKLGRSFAGIHETLARQQALLEPLQRGEALSAAGRTELAQLQQQGAHFLNTAITGLQFHDMTSQLIGRIAGHVGSVRDCFDGVRAASVEIPAGGDDAAVRSALAKLDRHLGETGVAHATVARKAVAQTHMESGDIELF